MYMQMEHIYTYGLDCSETKNGSIDTPVNQLWQQRDTHMQWHEFARCAYSLYGCRAVSLLKVLGISMLHRSPSKSAKLLVATEV